MDLNILDNDAVNCGKLRTMDLVDIVSPFLD